MWNNPTINEIWKIFCQSSPPPGKNPGYALGSSSDLSESTLFSNYKTLFSIFKNQCLGKDFVNTDNFIKKVTSNSIRIYLVFYPKQLKSIRNKFI